MEASKKFESEDGLLLISLHPIFGCNHIHIYGKELQNEGLTLPSYNDLIFVHRQTRRQSLEMLSNT